MVAPALAWPEIVWDAPLLRGLDARARSEIEAAGRLRRLRDGEAVYRAGDPADGIFVVASGACLLVGVRRGDADAAVIRRAEKGDVIGEEATIAAFSSRQLDARASGDVVVAEVPLVVLRRAVARSDNADLMAKIERGLRRAATLDLLRTTSFTRALPAADLELLLDAAKHVHVARGEHVYRENDVAADAFLVADGLLQAQTDDAGTPRVEAYLTRGDVFGDEELADRSPRGVAVVASGPAWLVAIPREVFVLVARRNSAGLEATRRLRSAGAPPKQSAGTHTTAHVFQDLYRMRIARSLLVIDQDACIRCGHCAWSCADVHEDGVSRLVRRGDKIAVLDGRGDQTTAPLLVPNSCQHCKNPSCMIDCPTGAIGRDARGEVFIREDLCTGCGSCAKACPWENIQMAPRPASTAGAYPTVAVKCDLCKGVDGGPACVASCPAQAIGRIEPSAALVELRLSASATPTAPVLPPRIAAWPWALGAALAGLGVAPLGIGGLASGVACGVLVAALVFYAAAKRVRGPIAKLRGRIPLARGLYVAHLSLGALALGVIGAHTGPHLPPTVAGALLVAIAGALATGIAGAGIAGFVPRMLSRIEQKSVLPEELAARPREIDERIFSTLSGKSELVKTLFVKVLRPYRRARLGPMFLVGSRRTLRAEQKALRARIDALTGKKRGDAVSGLDELVRLAVEHRAVRAQRLLTWTLRGWLVPHLAFTVAAVVLLVLHVVAVAT